MVTMIGVIIENEMSLPETIIPLAIIIIPMVTVTFTLMPDDIELRNREKELPENQDSNQGGPT